MELPRSPCSTSPNHFTYCTGSGWSRPNLVRSSSAAAGSAASNSIAANGSPGTIRSMKKTSVATAHITMTAPRQRRRRYFVMARAGPDGAGPALR